MTTQLSKALQAVWTTAMGGFLGLAAGLVFAVILAFRRAEKMAATPGIEPYNRPAFEAYADRAVAGAIGQDLFTVGGGTALALLGLAVLAHVGQGVLKMLWPPRAPGRKSDSLRTTALIATAVFMLAGANTTRQMNAQWPGLYDTQATADTLRQRRDAFDQLHQHSECFVGIAWISALFALGISPWCRLPDARPNRPSPPGEPVDRGCDRGRR